jgi:hypothetical protein
MRKTNALVKLGQALRSFVKPSKDTSGHYAPVRKYQPALRKPKHRTFKQVSEVRAETIRASEYIVHGNRLRYREVIRSSVQTRHRTVSSRG